MNAVGHYFPRQSPIDMTTIATVIPPPTRKPVPVPVQPTKLVYVPSQNGGTFIAASQMPPSASYAEKPVGDSITVGCDSVTVEATCGNSPDCNKKIKYDITNDVIKSRIGYICAGLGFQCPECDFVSELKDTPC